MAQVERDFLQSLIERIERLEEEKKAITDDIRDVYAEAKNKGYEAAVVRQIVKLRKMDEGDRLEQEELLNLYKEALGMSL